VLCYELAVARWWNDVLRDEIWPFLRSVRLRIMYEVRFGLVNSSRPFAKSTGVLRTLAQTNYWTRELLM